MSNGNQDQPADKKPAATPAWLREPEAPPATPKKARAETDEEQTLEEPGYGHGV